jgi:hypothetical protein
MKKHYEKTTRFHMVRVYRDSQWDEWRVRHYSRSTQLSAFFLVSNCDSFHAEKSDAVETADYEIAQYAKQECHGFTHTDGDGI